MPDLRQPIGVCGTSVYTNAYPDRNRNSITDRDANGHATCDRYPEQYADPDADADTHVDSDTIPDRDRDSHADADGALCRSGTGQSMRSGWRRRCDRLHL